MGNPYACSLTGFTAAKAMRLDILEDIRAAVDRAIADGWTFAEFQRRLEPLLRRKGWWGRRKEVDPRTGRRRTVPLGSARRLRVRDYSGGGGSGGFYHPAARLIETAANAAAAAHEYLHHLQELPGFHAPWDAFFAARTAGPLGRRPLRKVRYNDELDIWVREDRWIDDYMGARWGDEEGYETLPRNAELLLFEAPARAGGEAPARRGSGAARLPARLLAPVRPVARP